MLTQAEYENTLRRLQNIWKTWISRQLKHPLPDLNQTIAQIIAIRDSLLAHPALSQNIETSWYEKGMEEFALLGVYPEQANFPERFQYFNQWAFGETLIYFAESQLYESMIIQALNAYEKGVGEMMLKHPDYSGNTREALKNHPEYFVEFLALCDKRAYLMPEKDFFENLLKDRAEAFKRYRSDGLKPPTS